MAAAYFHTELSEILEGRDIIHFGDNTAANAAARSGYSSAPDMARVVSHLRLRWLKLGVHPWVEFVKSEANWSDDPSRGEVDLLEKRSAKCLRFEWPPFTGWH